MIFRFGCSEVLSFLELLRIASMRDVESVLAMNELDAVNRRVKIADVNANRS